MVRPIFGNGNLKHGMIFIQFYVIENVIRTVTDCCPLCELFFRVDYFICTVMQQKFFLNIRCSSGNYKPRS